MHSSTEVVQPLSAPSPEKLQTGYKETFDYAGVGIAQVGLDGRFIDLNSRFCEMMGRSKDELLHLTFQDLTYPDDLDANLDLLRALLAGEIPSYRMEKRYVDANGKVFWADLTVSPHRDASGKPLTLISIIADITRQKEAQERLRFLMNELSHRTKNLASVVQAIVNQTAASAQSVGDFRAALNARLAGIAASEDLTAYQQNHSSDLFDLIRRQLEVFLTRDDSRITMEGPDLTVSADASRGIGMALHELITNALKHGALSSASGRVRIAWRIDREAAPPTLTLSWLERGGPAVMPPSRTGFGRRVIESMVATSTHGKVDMRFDPEGVSWSLVAPLDAVLPLRP